MTPDEAEGMYNGGCAAAFMERTAPRQPPRIDLPVSPEPAERDALRVILAAIETEHIDPRDVYRELRPALARLAKALGSEIVNAPYDYGASLLDAARVLERATAREQWTRLQPMRARMRRVRETYGPKYECAFERNVFRLMRDAWRLFVNGS